jgi:DHA1 family tetracycline resistance protein-like MFS transporter
LGPLMGSPLLAAVSHYPHGDWRVGAPFYLCAAIQAVAAIMGLRYFSRSFRATEHGAAAQAPV